MPYNKLIDGFHVFQKGYINSEKGLYYKKLVEGGQKPETLIIACSDSRIDPAILTNSDPGEFFAIRNVAALVPPYNNGGKLRGTSSAIEYAVRHLGVKHIVVLGHAGCGGINALATDDYQATSSHNFQFLHEWLNIGTEAKEQIFTKFNCFDETEKIRALEQAAILVSIKNLTTFPWIKDKCNRKEIQIHGWYFDMFKGNLLEYNSQTSLFEKIKNPKTSAVLLNNEPNFDEFLNNYAQNCNCHSNN